jgi:hypothetical protein
LVDLNDDGALDFVVANQDDDTVTVFRGSPARDGTFTFLSQIILPAGSRPTALVMADVNMDGLEDFLIGSHLGDDVRILLGNGTGSGTYVGMFPLPAGSRIFDMKAGDLDGDGATDLVVAYSAIHQAGLFMGNGDGTFVEGLAVSVADANEVHGVALGDLDEDGILDLVLSARTPGIVSARLGDGYGGFAGTALGGDINVGLGARQVALSDVNLDGHLDLVTAVYDLGVIDIRLGIGNGNFYAFVRPQ